MESAITEAGQSDRLLFVPEHARTQRPRVREVPEMGIELEKCELPRLKAENGSATYGDMKTSWFKDSESKTLAVSNEIAGFVRKAA